MKAQMVPSDDVIDSLLAAISSETSFENKRTFDIGDIGSPEARKRRRRRSGFDLRAVSKYVAATAAAVMLIAGTISLIGDGGDNKLGEVIGNVVDNPSVAIGSNEEPAATGEDNSVSEPDSVTTQSGDNAVDGGTSDENETADNADKTDDKGESSAEAKPVDTANDSDKSEPTSSDKPAVKPENGETSDRASKDDSEDNKNTEADEEAEWVKEVLAVEAPQAVLMGESYVVSDAVAAVSSSDAGSLVFSRASEDSDSDEATYRIKAKKIKKVSPNIMVGVKIPDSGETLIYINRDYAPSTLGEFLRDSGISGNIDFGSVIYTEKSDESRSANYYAVNSHTAIGVMSEFVFSQTYADTIGSAYNNREETFATFISSGYQNPMGLDIKFEINQNGHLYISLSSGNAYTFYIGEDQTDELLETLKASL